MFKVFDNIMVIREKVKKEIQKGSLSQNEIARRCEIDEGNFSKFLQGKINISIDKLDEVLKFLKIELTSK